MIRLIIADDHAILRSGLKRIFALVSDMEVVGEAENGSEVLSQVQKVEVDLLLLDLNMPGIDGVELIQRVRAHRKGLPILILSMHNEPQVATKALHVGADGYVTKDCETEVLLLAIRKVANGGQFIAPNLAERIVFGAKSAETQSPERLLSDRELVIYKHLVSGKGVNDIALELAISNKTVSTHKMRLMEKLGLKTTTDLLRHAMARGLIQ